MTKPPLARQRGGYDDSPRTYPWPPEATGEPIEFEVTSVTGATDNFPKPWLTGWAVKMTAERAVDKYRRLGEMIEEDGEKEALSWLKKARYTSSGDKANRGTVVHGALEAYLHGEELSKEQIDAELKKRRVPRALWLSTAAMVAGLFKFLDDEKPEIVWSEQTVFSREYHYAGTPDIVGYMVIDGERRPVIIDVKTSKDIYDDTACQLIGYARAEFAGMLDGTEVPLLPLVPEMIDVTGMDGVPVFLPGETLVPEPILHGVVVRPLADGTYESALFDLTDDVFDVFLACLKLTTAKDVVAASRRP